MNTEIVSIEKIKGCEFAQEAIVITLSKEPTKEEMDKLFINDSIVLEF